MRIHRATGLSRSTIRKYLDSAEVPKRAVRRPVPRNLDPFVDYVGSRWRSGCHNAHRLYTEIVAIGYTGSESMLRKLVQPWRTHPQPSAAEHDSRVMRCIWKDVRWSVLRPQEQLRADEREYLKTFLDLHSRLALAYDLVQRFRLMLHARQVEELDCWLATARASKLTPFERLGRTLAADRSAVMAAIELQWSTGQVEGQITRVKLLKRLGYGRASLTLLRARIIGL